MIICGTCQVLGFPFVDIKQGSAEMNEEQA